MPEPTLRELFEQAQRATLEALDNLHKARELESKAFWDLMDENRTGLPKE